MNHCFLHRLVRPYGQHETECDGVKSLFVHHVEGSEAVAMETVSNCHSCPLVKLMLANV